MLKQILMLVCCVAAFDALAQSSAAKVTTGASLSDKVKFHFSVLLDSDGKLSLFYGKPSSVPEQSSEMEVRCRPNSPDMQSILAEPALAPLSFLYGESTSVFSGNTVSVSGNWLKLGLQIENKTKDWILVIEDIVLFAEAEHEGEVFHYRQDLSRGYCGLPFLYVVPDGISLHYDPFSDNPLENLTLYIDGFPSIDGTSGAGSTVPEYKMDLVIFGRFISIRDDKKPSVEVFLKKLKLTTSLQPVSEEYFNPER